MNRRPQIDQLRKENADLRQRLAEAEETLRAITSGEVDALVVNARVGEQVFTLQGADTVYRTAIENINEGAVTLSLEGSILFSNHYFARMVRADLYRVIGASMFDFVNPPDGNSFRALLAQENGRAEVTLRSADGTPVPAYVATKRQQLDNAVSVICIVTDLTEQKRNQRIIAHERLVRSIMAQSVEALLVCDPSGLIIHASEGANNLGAGRVTGLMLDDAINGLRAGEERFSLAALERGHFPNGTEFTAEIGGETRSYMLLHGVLKSEGNILGRIITLTDITERKRAEQLKDEFVGMVSHELRTPLTVIIGALATASDPRVSRRESRELLGDAITGADALAGIIDNLLELSRFQARRFGLQAEKVNIPRLVRETATKFKSKSAAHGIVVDIGPRIPTVTADAVRIERILCNLLDNAIKYSPHGGDITVSVRRNRGSVVIGVADHGMGISKEDQSRLFQPFQRLTNGVPSSIHGVGLGLNVCHRLVEAHGGRIWVNSTRGKGSTFYFSLPANSHNSRHSS